MKSCLQHYENKKRRAIQNEARLDAEMGWTRRWKNEAFRLDRRVDRLQGGDLRLLDLVTSCSATTWVREGGEPATCFWPAEYGKGDGALLPVITSCYVGLRLAGQPPPDTVFPALMNQAAAWEAHGARNLGRPLRTVSSVRKLPWASKSWGWRPAQPARSYNPQLNN